MKHDLWSEVERALDARRSPFEDAELAARLARAPEEARAVRRLEQRLGRLAAAEGGRRPKRRVAWAAAGVVAAGIVACAAWSLASRSPAASASAPLARLTVRSETYEPRLARVTLVRERVVAWTGAEGRP